MFSFLRDTRGLKRLRLLIIVFIVLIFWAWELLEHLIIPEPTTVAFLLELAIVTLLISTTLYFLFNELIKVFCRLEESNQQLLYLKNYQESILESSPHAIVAIDKDGLITSFNVQAESISGYTTTNAIGMNIFRFFTNRTKIQQALKTAHCSNNIETIKETELITKQGVQIPVLLLIKRIKYKDHNDGGFVIILEDLREKKRLQQRLVVSEKMAAVSQLAAGLAHEIRNPLASISVNIKNLEDQYIKSNVNTKEYERYFMMISSDINRLNQLLNKFVKSIVPKETEANLRLFQIDEIISIILQRFQKIIKDKQIVVKTNYPTDPVYIGCDKEQLIQAFSNIIQNSVEAISTSGELDIEIQEKGDWGQVKICDTGCGISPENLEHIFDFYFTTKTSGLGIGLPFASLVIEQHGGKIEIESKPNNGTCVMVFLPLKKIKTNE